MIAFRNAGFQYPDGTRIGPIDLTLEPGEVHLLTGESGSGKTGITKMANGIVHYLFEGEKFGEVFIKGTPIKDLSLREFISGISSVYQNPKTQFFTDNTTSELVFPLENLGYRIHEMEEILTKVRDFFGIGSLLNRRISELSGGEKQILSIAGSLMTNPDVIVLDEPTGNLDLASIVKVREMLLKLKDLKKTILISEHRLHYLKDVVDRVSLVRHGQIFKTYEGRDFYQLSEEERKSLGLRNLRKVEMTPLWKESRDNSFGDPLEIEKLFKRVGKKERVHVENVTLYGGRIYFLIGKNGAGKSTFAKNLVGLQKATEERIYWQGRRISPKERLKNAYLVFQDVNTQLFTSSVGEEIDLNNHFPQGDQWLSELNLSHKKEAHPQSLSGGEKQRVSLAAGIASNKKILIADEPTSGMDYGNMMNLCKLLKNYVKKGNILLVISHDLEFIGEVAEEVLFMKEGRIIGKKKRNPELIDEVDFFLR